MVQDLARHGPLGRFDPSVEAEYQRWFVRRIAPLCAAMGVLSLVIWGITPLLGPTLLDLDRPWLAFVICWGFFLPALTCGVVYARRPDPRHMVAVATALIGITAVATIAFLIPGVPDIDSTGFALAATFFGALAPMVQVPFRTTVVLSLVITAAGEVGAVVAADGDTGGALYLSVLWIPLGTVLVGSAMAFSIESGLRGRFVDEKTIEHQRSLIRRYAPSSVVSRIELGDHTVDHPQRRKVTVFFSDVVGFTQLADRVDPEALAEIVNDYLGSLADLIERHGGTLNEFAGDGVMAIFGAPDDMDPADQVHAALAAARELQNSLPTWSRGWYQHGIVEDAQARVGINTGTISVGTFGSTIRATYTGIGLQTNIAARVQAQAEPGGILLSNTSWHLIKDDVACDARGEVTVKGVHFPIELYAPAD